MLIYYQHYSKQPSKGPVNEEFVDEKALAEGQKFHIKILKFFFIKISYKKFHANIKKIFQKIKRFRTKIFMQKKTNVEKNLTNSIRKFLTKNFIQKISYKKFLQKVSYKKSYIKMLQKILAKKFHTKITYKKIHTKNKKINVEKNCHRKLKKMF